MELFLFEAGVEAEPSHSVPEQKERETVVTVGAFINDVLTGEDRKLTDDEGDGTRLIEMRRQFLEDLRATRLQQTIAMLECAILVFHSPLDRVVTLDHGARIFELAPHAKSFFVLHEADHLLTDRRDADYIATMIASWLDRYE